MKKFFVIILISITSSCSSYNELAGTDQNIKKISLGMSRKKIISIMGKNYEVIAANDSIYTLGYKTPDNGMYKLVFMNNKLDKWVKEWRMNHYYIR